jgi:hypothetical protein
MFDFLGDAYDGFMSLFNGGSETPTLDSSISGQVEGGGLDLSGGNNYDSNLFSFEAPTIEGHSTGGGLNKPNLSNVPEKDPFYLNPNLLGAGITAGAALFQGMGNQSIQKQQLKAAEEARKMNNLLELAKLKNQILMKGSSGSGGRRASGGGGSGQAEAVDRQYSTNKISQLSNLGANLANIYRG